VIDYSTVDSTVGQNWYELDPDLQTRVEADCPPDDLDWARTKLHDFGALVGGRVARNADIIDVNPPALARYDRWANEVNEVVHHPAAIDSKRALWEAGFVSGFAADERERGRTTPGVVLAARNYLVSQADTGMVCSLGMTSGVAGLVAAYAPPDVRDRLLAGLRADDLDHGTDGSMFLTEREGGSDLGSTVHCVARDLGDGRVELYGEKWFCSNIDGAAMVVLARPEDASEGSTGIGLYLVPRYLDDGSRNNYSMRRLKQKLGTRSVPTGEIEFNGTLAYAMRPRRAADDSTQASSDAGGLNRMMEMVNGSRFGVALMGLGIGRRSFLEAAVWAHHRRAKGRLLIDLPLAREQLVDLLVELEAAFALAFECAAATRNADGARLRRILVPAAKVRCCRFGVEASSAAIEMVGGNGYCEDWGLTRQLRDAQCHPIWEGSENICALDVLRAIRREEAHEAVLARIDTALAVVGNGNGAEYLRQATEAVGFARNALADRVKETVSANADEAEARASQLTNLIVRATSGALLLEQAVDDHHKGLVALRFARRHLIPDALWTDQIALTAGRDLVAFADIDAATATRAAA
jgi:alkylation response protein AidB-like acyl-CoA dehydrogenase